MTSSKALAALGMCTAHGLENGVGNIYLPHFWNIAYDRLVFHLWEIVNNRSPDEK